MELKYSKVEFFADSHEYYLSELKLRGITPIIGEKLFPNKYAQVSKEVLQKKCEKGSNVHEECQKYDMFGALESDASDEVRAYAKLVEEKNLTSLANEYLVSDNKLFATAIDKVDEELNLYDFKTTYKLDEEYLSWQLSICQYLFELQNPKLKVKNLFGIWLRGSEAKLVKIKKKTKKQVESVLYGDIKIDDFTLDIITALKKDVADAENKLSEAKKNLEDATELVIKEMLGKGMKSVENDNIKVTYTPPTKSKKFDAKALEKDNAEIYEKYITFSDVKAKTTITLKKQDDE